MLKSELLLCWPRLNNSTALCWIEISKQGLTKVSVGWKINTTQSSWFYASSRILLSVCLPRLGASAKSIQLCEHMAELLPGGIFYDARYSKLYVFLIVTVMYFDNIYVYFNNFQWKLLQDDRWHISVWLHVSKSRLPLRFCLSLKTYLIIRYVQRRMNSD